jgi:hypothetical protein
MDAFTMEMRLCDDYGQTDLEKLNRLRYLSKYPAYTGLPFACTGSAHLAGEHVRCTSPAHKAVTGTPLNGWQVATADALPERPERLDDPLPEDLERLLRDPEIAVAQDVAVHTVIRKHLRANPEATVTRSAYLNLWALIETGAFNV